ncbi:MAG: D-glycero-beta-D-manno-heptose-7-phosphate kinase [Candidatus Omnitrophota bacterium]|nr:D-glycero-beta-D-manno-heptose-7-phosphate kinase [Candidatus Omnitrophota bacterium]
METAKLKKIISNFPKANILVVGDLILDQYIWGEVERVSPEAPVPVVWAKSRTYVPGGAANVANNIRSLGAAVSLLGLIGKDAHADILLTELKKRKIDTTGILVEPGRYTTLKTRDIAGHQQLVRVDWEHTEALPDELNQKIIRFVKNNINNFAAVIIEDYGKGVINEALLKELIALTRKAKKLITVDPKEENFQYYSRVTAITPNRRELENAVRNLKVKDTENRFKLNYDRLLTDKDIDAAARQIMEYLGLESMLVTLGEQGMRLFEAGGGSTYIPTVAQEVFDVSGAGDTVISVFTLALSCGAAKPEAAHLANYAAGIVVGKLGTAVTTREELLEKISKMKER